MSAPPHRRISARRGSTTAPDPFGVHAVLNLNPNRSSTSKLTIVRAPPAIAPLSLADPAPSQRRLHRRIPPASSSSTTERVSFAFSTFGARSSSPDPSSSPSSSPRIRPSSPHLTASSFGGKPRLTPDQLVDLARQSTAIRTTADPPAPAAFTPLPDDIYLPFIDRPTEVAALISSPPDLKLFSLLAQIFRNKHPVPVPDLPTHDLPRDPAQWTYAQLLHHLTHIDRDVAPDFVWAIAARKSIFSHSELLWERIKGALGIPPDLDLDYDFLDDDQDSPDTSDISDDEGRAAKGHWSDWDDVMDSPVRTRLAKDSDAFRAQMDDKLHGLQHGFVHSSAATTSEADGGDSTIAPTPHGLRSPPDVEGLPLDRDIAEYISIEPLIAPSPSPSQSFGSTPPISLPASIASGDGLGDIAEGAEEEDTEQPTLDVVAPPDDQLISPSQIQGLRISTSPLPPSSTSFGTPPILSPVSPLPPYPSTTSMASLNSYASTTTPPQLPGTSSRSHSRNSSFSSVGPFQRSESTGNLAASWSAMAAAAIAAGGAGYAGSAVGSGYAPSAYAGSDAGDSVGGYLSDGDRIPGNPIFPSNFARLAGGPTLRANNPSTRSQVVRHVRYLSTGSTGSVASEAASVSPSKQGKPRTFSQGASTLASRALAGKRQSWGSGVGEASA